MPGCDRQTARAVDVRSIATNACRPRRRVIVELSSVQLGYARSVKTALTHRVTQAATKYGDQAPMVGVCCNACRTCTTTNLLALASGAVLAAGYGVGRFAKRIVKPS